MPANIVKTPAEEKKWEKAKELAKEQGEAGNWPYIVGIFKKMSPDRFKASNEGHTMSTMATRVASNYMNKAAAPTVINRQRLERSLDLFVDYLLGKDPQGTLTAFKTYMMTRQQGVQNPPAWLANDIGYATVQEKVVAWLLPLMVKKLGLELGAAPPDAFGSEGLSDVDSWGVPYGAKTAAGPPIQVNPQRLMLAFDHFLDFLFLPDRQATLQAFKQFGVSGAPAVRNAPADPAALEALKAKLKKDLFIIFKRDLAAGGAPVADEAAPF
jgi:hypothetical protein